MKAIRISLAMFIFFLGSIIPFVDYLVVIEAFYMLIPLTILFVASSMLIVARLFSKGLQSSRIFFIVWIIPILMISQFISTYVVDKIQRYRSELIIDEIETMVTATSNFPVGYATPIGIELKHFAGEMNFKITYSRGFMTTEVYDSRLRSWKSYGWND